MEKTYYYRVGEQQVGPVSLDQMRGAVNLDTYVWSEGMANWQAKPCGFPYTSLSCNRHSPTR